MTRRIFTLAALFVALPHVALTQGAPRRGWVDVNVLSIRVAQDEQAYLFSTIVASETATAATAYPRFPSATTGGVELGFRF